MVKDSVSVMAGGSREGDMGSDNGSIAVPRMSVQLMQGGCYGMKKRKNREIKKWVMAKMIRGEEGEER